jgi:hypothetical protein
MSLSGPGLWLADPMAFRKIALMCSFTAALSAPTSATISAFSLPAFGSVAVTWKRHDEPSQLGRSGSETKELIDQADFACRA